MSENKRLEPHKDITDKTSDFYQFRKSGGLWRNVKMSVKTANIIVTVLIIALIVAVVFALCNRGFVVKFDTDGGSQIESIKLMYGDKIPEDIEDPVKEGYTFTGWYYDRDCTAPWDLDNDVVTDSFTLYAGWEEKS